jgi:ABC-type arginine/histidine transport system permease subunit
MYMKMWYIYFESKKMSYNLKSIYLTMYVPSAWEIDLAALSLNT